jgi:hypothetical protein
MNLSGYGQITSVVVSEGGEIAVDRELVAVITTTNFGRRDAHALSDSLLTDEILQPR